jgi:hypothetical protein
MTPEGQRRIIETELERFELPRMELEINTENALGQAIFRSFFTEDRPGVFRRDATGLLPPPLKVEFNGVQAEFKFIRGPDFEYSSKVLTLKLELKGRVIE